MTDVDGVASAEANPVTRRLTDWDRARLTALANTHGTPLYVQDLDRVRQNCARMRSAFPDADVRYAVKAHTGRAVLETVREAGLDAECASAGEVDRALTAGFTGEHIHYTAVNPPARDLDRVVDIAAEAPAMTVTLGAVDTLDRLIERGYDGRVCLRVNPGVGAGHHAKVRTGAAPKFGIPYDRAERVAREAATRVDVVGIHAHAGSGIDADGLEDHRSLVSRMGSLARSLTAPATGELVADTAGNGQIITDPLALEYVDVGGGFGVPYRADEPPLDLDAVAEASRVAPQCRSRYRTRPVRRRRRGRPPDACEHGETRGRRRLGRYRAGRRRRRRRHDDAPPAGDVRRLPQYSESDRRAPGATRYGRRPRL